MADAAISSASSPVDTTRKPAAGGGPGKRRDTLFLNDVRDSIGGFSFGFTEGHLPVAQQETEGIDGAAAAAAAASSNDHHQQEDGLRALLFMQQDVGSDSTAISLEQLNEARREVEGAGMAFFFPASVNNTSSGSGKKPIKAAPLLDPEAHVQNVRRIFTQVRQDAAMAELRKKQANDKDGDAE